MSRTIPDNSLLLLQTMQRLHIAYGQPQCHTHAVIEQLHVISGRPVIYYFITGLFTCVLVELAYHSIVSLRRALIVL